MNEIKTPYFLIDESLIEKNCKILARVRNETGCRVLLAQKAYSAYDTYPLIAKYLDGTTASGLFEARLGKERFGKETHVFAPAFTDADMREIVKIADHIIFNSKVQLMKHYDICKKNGLKIGVRVNPECKTQEHDIYDPCAKFSRFGIKAADLDADILGRIDGLHFHTLCEQTLEPLQKTVAEFEKKFGQALKFLKGKGQEWFVNFGGGHHITREDYDVSGLVKLINDFKSRHGCMVYLEPGEAVVLNGGTLTASVLDIVHNGKDIAILDTSAACHNPDVLETQHGYTPEVVGATLNTKSATHRHHYRLAGNTCLAGDIIGDYAFGNPLKIGETVTFTNMALYTMVKTNMFNGINLPSIYIKRLNGKVELVREFGYADYVTRLGGGKK